MPALLSVALAAALTSAAPAPTPLPSLPPAMVHIAMPSFTAARTSVSVKVDAPFQIRLKVNAGTGYSWRPRGPLAPGLRLLGVFQSPQNRMMPGGPGQQVLVFRAADAGKFKLTLDYVRPWERGVAPAKTQTFTVTVHR